MVENIKNSVETLNEENELSSLSDEELTSKKQKAIEDEDYLLANKIKVEQDRRKALKDIAENLSDGFHVKGEYKTFAGRPIKIGYVKKEDETSGLHYKTWEVLYDGRMHQIGDGIYADSRFVGDDDNYLYIRIKQHGAPNSETITINKETGESKSCTNVEHVYHLEGGKTAIEYSEKKGDFFEEYIEMGDKKSSIFNVVENIWENDGGELVVLGRKYERPCLSIGEKMYDLPGEFVKETDKDIICKGGGVQLLERWNEHYKINEVGDGTCTLTIGGKTYGEGENRNTIEVDNTNEHCAPRFHYSKFVYLPKN